MLAKLTKGYAFAYQVVGYLFSKYRKIDKIHDELDQYLSIYVYDKIWAVLPNKEKELLKSFDKDEMSIEELLRKTHFDDKAYSVYRQRLIRRGLLASSGHGKIATVLPRFVEYIDKQRS